MTNSTQLNVDKSNKQCWRVTIDNPPINLMTPEMLIGWDQLVGQMEVDPDLHVVVFDSANPDFFVNHLDTSRLADLPTTPGPTGLPMVLDFFIRLSLAPVVTIALIRGRTRGGGLEFALACDMRFASTEKAVFCQSEVGNGNFPGAGGLERLPGLIGRGRALEVVLGSNDFDATTADHYGIINRALPDDQVDDFVNDLARRLCLVDREAIRTAKRQVNRHTLPMNGDIESSYLLYLQSVSWPGAADRRALALKRGRNQPGDYELNLGYHLGLPPS